jgi:hypothetical protein
MISVSGRSGFLALALALAALAGCNATEEVRSEPFIELPAATVVLQGTVSGLGSKRSLELRNNGLATDGIPVVAPIPTPDAIDIFPTVFTFGARAVKDANGNPVPYDVQIHTQPQGKTCTFRPGTLHSGILSTASPPNIVIDCVPSPDVPLYDVTVILDPSFANAPGAKVQLTTEEAIYEQAVTPADVLSGTLTFRDKLFNGNGAGAPTNAPVFAWAVSATTSQFGTVNKCPVLRPSGVNPISNISGAGVAPQVLACSFTISGAIYYSRPAGVAADPALGAGLTLELRNLNGVRKGAASIAPGGFPINFTFNNLEPPAPTLFTSNPDADFEVVVTNHPEGQTCIVPDGGYVSLRSLVNLNPVNVTATGVTTSGAVPAAGAAAAANAPVPGTRLIVVCRNRPASADRLNGVYRLTETVAQMVSFTGEVSTVTSSWRPLDLTVQNTASSNVITFFDDGTFLYGAHHATVQVEHGFYDYSATLPATTLPGTPPGRLRLTLLTDTFFNTAFPSGFSSAEITSPASASTTTPGISALPGKLTYTTAPNAPYPFLHINMGNVVKTAAAGSTPATITATAGPYGGTAASISSSTFVFSGPIAILPPAPAAPATTSRLARQVDWELTEVRNLDGEFTGGWISQDHRRFWVWDRAHTYGSHVGVNGFAHMESACFVAKSPGSPSGTMQRRSGQTGCYPINRPRLLPTPQAYTTLGLEGQDSMILQTTHVSSTTSTAPATVGGAFATGNVVPGLHSTAQLAARFPNYEGRIPGGQSALDGRHVSPTYYHVAPAVTFSSSAPAMYFPAPAMPFTSWCTTEILGLRATVNDVPFRQPVYLCRTRAQ